MPPVPATVPTTTIPLHCLPATCSPACILLDFHCTRTPHCVLPALHHALHTTICLATVSHRVCIWSYRRRFYTLFCSSVHLPFCLLPAAGFAAVTTATQPFTGSVYTRFLHAAAGRHAFSARTPYYLHYHAAAFSCCAILLPPAGFWILYLVRLPLLPAHLPAYLPTPCVGCRGPWFSFRFSSSHTCLRLVSTCTLPLQFSHFCSFILLDFACTHITMLHTTYYCLPVSLPAILPFYILHTLPFCYTPFHCAAPFWIHCTYPPPPRFCLGSTHLHCSPCLPPVLLCKLPL